MEKTYSFDKKIKNELLKVDEINFSEGIFPQVLAGIKQQPSNHFLAYGIKKYVLVTICALFLLVGATFTFSADARNAASGVVESVRTVFVLDKNEQVVEKSSDQVFITPAVTLNTELSDTALSKRIGIHVRFPQILNGNYKLQRKAEAVGFSLPLGYETFNDLQLKAEEAINNQEAFNSLKEYKPYRSVGGVYKNEAGLSFGLVIQDKSIPLSTENIKFTTTTTTHINDLDATWKGLSYPNYPDNDMTQKPDGIITTHILMWSKDNATYIILPLGNSNLSMQAVVSQAEAFMNAQ